MALYPGKKTKRTRRKRSMYSSNYRYKRSTRIWRNLAVIAVCAGIFAVGFFLLGPALDGLLNIKPEDVSSSAGDVSSGTETDIPSDPPASSSDTSGPSYPVPGHDGANTWLLLTADRFTDPAKLSEQITEAVNGGIDGLMLEVKGHDGLLNYRSQLEQVNSILAVSENAVDLAQVVSQIKTAGLSCGVTLWVYDEVYTASQLRDAAIKYNGSDSTRWMDYARGEPSFWQDPGLAAAQEYELDIIRELCGFEIDTISLMGCHYPVWGSLVGCSYDTSRTKVENITWFVSEARAAANSAGILLDVTVTADVAAGDTHSRYANYGYPQDLYELDCDSLTVDLRLDDLLHYNYPAITVDGVAYSDLVSDRDGSLRMLYAAASARAGGRRDITVLTDDRGGTASGRIALLKSAGAEKIVCQTVS